MGLSHAAYPTERSDHSLCVTTSGTLGPFPAVFGCTYEPFMGNTFMGSRVFPSGASIDSLSTYQARAPMVYRARRRARPTPTRCGFYDLAEEPEEPKEPEGLGVNLLLPYRHPTL